jgi:hypothetical protein
VEAKQWMCLSIKDVAVALLVAVAPDAAIQLYYTFTNTIPHFGVS